MPSIALNSSLKIFSQLLENKFKTKNVEQQYRLLDQLDWSEIANAATEMIFFVFWPNHLDMWQSTYYFDIKNNNKD